MKEINIRDIKENAVSLISDGWGLVTVADSDTINPMTVSWGALGEIWGKDAAFIFIRENRYTYRFLEKGGLFTLSFYDEKYRPAGIVVSLVPAPAPVFWILHEMIIP